MRVHVHQTPRTNEFVAQALTEDANRWCRDEQSTRAERSDLPCDDGWLAPGQGDAAQDVKSVFRTLASSPMSSLR